MKGNANKAVKMRCGVVRLFLSNSCQFQARDVRRVLGDERGCGAALVALAVWLGACDAARRLPGYSDSFSAVKLVEAHPLLVHARNLLEPVKERHPHISYADIWTLAAVSAIEAAGGPCIEWRPGRLDHLSILETAPRVRIQARNGNSPPLRRASTSASLANASNLRQLNQLGASSLGESDLRASCIQFGLDWTDRNLVALAGYPLYPGNELFGNQFFKDLVDLRINNADLDLDVDATEESWLLRALTRDEEFWNIVREYAADELAFREDFAIAFSKLIHLSVPLFIEHSVYEDEGFTSARARQKRKAEAWATPSLSHVLNSSTKEDEEASQKPAASLPSTNKTRIDAELISYDNWIEQLSLSADPLDVWLAQKASASADDTSTLASFPSLLEELVLADDPRHVTAQELLPLISEEPPFPGEETDESQEEEIFFDAVEIHEESTETVQLAEARPSFEFEFCSDLTPLVSSGFMDNDENQILDALLSRLDVPTGLDRLLQLDAFDPMDWKPDFSRELSILFAPLDAIGAARNSMAFERGRRGVGWAEPLATEVPRQREDSSLTFFHLSFPRLGRRKGEKGIPSESRARGRTSASFGKLFSFNYSIPLWRVSRDRVFRK